MEKSLFLLLFSAYAVIAGLVTEFIKKLTKNKETISYNIVAVIAAVVVGVIGTIIYYVLSSTAIGLSEIIYAVLLGFASGIGSMVGYDKVKQAIDQLIPGKANKEIKAEDTEMKE